MDDQESNHDKNGDGSIIRKRKHSFLNTEKDNQDGIIPVYGIEQRIIPPEEVRDQFLKIATGK